MVIPDGNCMFKVNNRNTRIRSEMCSKLTIKTPGVFIDNFDNILQLVLVLLLLTLSRKMLAGKSATRKFVATSFQKF